MSRNRTARPSNLLTAYWFIERPGAGRSEVFTVGVGPKTEALPVFSFPDEAEMFLKLGGFEEGGWRTVERTAGELVSRLAEHQSAGIKLVALDPLPEMVNTMFGLTIALVTTSLIGFAARHAAWSGEGFARG